MTADERVRMIIGDLMVQLQVALAKIEEMTKENDELKQRPQSPPDD
jgi:hypothetical protein